MPKVQAKNNRKIIKSSLLTGALVLVLGVFSIVTISSLSFLTERFNNHPLKVSISTHKIGKHIISIHRYMKDVVLSNSRDELKAALKSIAHDSKEINTEFDVIFSAYLGNAEDIKEAYDLFNEWENIRSDVIELVAQDKKKEALLLNQTVTFTHVENIHHKLAVITDYAHNKAETFVVESKSSKDRAITLILTIAASILLLIASVTFILLKSIKKANTLQIKQNQSLIDNARLSQMGELISMIAHQWRQPLSAISSTAINMNVQVDIEKYNLDEPQEREKFLSSYKDGLSKIMKFTQGLSTTIDDFRNFYKVDKDFTECNVEVPMKQSLSILKGDFIENNVTVRENLQSTKLVRVIKGELMQVFLNIFQNSKDAFIDNDIAKPEICIDTKDTEDGVEIDIYDNGGGMDDTLIEKIFEPYFSTRKSKNGTGLGMYMSNTIIKDHHNGKISAKNTDNGLRMRINLFETKA
ncbi:ATP-binding protein [Sulfurimonas sp.]|nr:ATP-binding protein [Sulfurimonas sp.]